MRNADQPVKCSNLRTRLRSSAADSSCHILVCFDLVARPVRLSRSNRTGTFVIGFATGERRRSRALDIKTVGKLTPAGVSFYNDPGIIYKNSITAESQSRVLMSRMGMRVDAKIKTVVKALGLRALLFCFAIVCVLPCLGRELQIPEQQIDNLPSGTPITIIEKLIDSGRLEEAQNRLKILMSSQGETSTTLYLEARILFKEQRFNESIDKLQRALSTGKPDWKATERSKRDARSDEPIESEAYKLIGLNYVLLNRLDLAEPFLKASVEQSPNDHVARFHLGLLYYSTSRFSVAESEFRRVVKLRPTFAKGHDMLGLTLEEIGNEEAATQSYRRAIELNRGQKFQDSSPYLNLGRFLLTKNRFEESLPLLQKAVHLHPKSAEGAFLLGKALNKLGKEAEAVKALGQSIQIDPTYAEPHYLLSRIYLSQGREADARQELQTFEQIRKTKP